MYGNAAGCAAAYAAHRHGHAAKRREPDHSRILGRVVSKQGLARLRRGAINQAAASPCLAAGKQGNRFQHEQKSRLFHRAPGFLNEAAGFTACRLLP